MIYVLTASDKGLFRLHPIQNQETNNNIFTPEIYIKHEQIRNDTNFIKSEDCAGLHLHCRCCYQCQ